MRLQRGICSLANLRAIVKTPSKDELPAHAAYYPHLWTGEAPCMSTSGRTTFRTLSKPIGVPRYHGLRLKEPLTLTSTLRLQSFQNRLEK